MRWFNLGNYVKLLRWVCGCGKLRLPNEERDKVIAGTREGGRRAAATNKLRYGQDFYSKAGRLGGLKSRGGGFAKNPELASIAGAKGGKMSRRGKSSKS